MLQFVIDTLIRCADLMLVAVGLSAVYSLVRFPNIAHVQYAAVGAFVTLFAQRAGLPLAAAAGVSCVLVGALAVALQVLVFERLLRAGPAAAMIGSLAVAMVLTALMLGVAGSRPLRYAGDVLPPVLLGGARLSPAQLVSVACGIGAWLLFALLLFKTPLGRAMRALAANPMLARATGVNALHVSAGITFLSGVMAALGGTLLASTGDAHINLGHDLLLPVFAAAILGGLGNPLGAAGGALLIAAAETLVTNIDFGALFGRSHVYLPVTYIGAASFAALLLALVFRPHGLFDRGVRRV